MSFVWVAHKRQTGSVVEDPVSVYRWYGLVVSALLVCRNRIVVLQRHFRQVVDGTKKPEVSIGTPARESMVIM